MWKYSRAMSTVQIIAQFPSGVLLNLAVFTSDISLQSIFVECIGSPPLARALDGDLADLSLLDLRYKRYAVTTAEHHF
jgi:hypothetical protein